MEKDFTSLELKADEIFQILKKDENSGYFNGLLVLMVLITLGAIVFHFIKFGFSPLLIFSILILFFYLIYYRIKMKSRYKVCTSLNNYVTLKDTDEQQYLNAYFNYLESGVQIKQTRSTYIKYLYIIIFPFFLILLKELWVAQYTSMSIIWGFLFAFIISFFVWSSFFRDDLDEWEILDEEIANYKSRVFL